MNILDLFRFVRKPKDQTERTHLTKNLYIAKLYSATHFGGDYDYDTPMSASLTSDHYVLLVESNGKYYVIPETDNQKAIEVSDINQVQREHELLIQPDSNKRFKPFTYYAPSSEYGFVTSYELRKIAKFIHYYFIKGDDHAHRRDLDVYYKFLRDIELTAEEKERLLSLEDFAKTQTKEDLNR